MRLDGCFNLPKGTVCHAIYAERNKNGNVDFARTFALCCARRELMRKGTLLISGRLTARAEYSHQYRRSFA